MKTLINITLILIASIVVSCSEKDCCVGLEEDGTKELAGEWILFERGYSPGAGYIVEPVGPAPPQIIDFKSNGELSCSVPGLTDYKFYAVTGDIVAFYKTDPGPSPDSLTFIHSYHFSFEGKELKLSFRYCIEGCHLGFRKAG
jgi:hypothetical protein